MQTKKRLREILSFYSIVIGISFLTICQQVYAETEGIEENLSLKPIVVWVDTHPGFPSITVKPDDLAMRFSDFVNDVKSRSWDKFLSYLIPEQRKAYTDRQTAGFQLSPLEQAGVLYAYIKGYREPDGIIHRSTADIVVAYKFSKNFYISGTGVGISTWVKESPNGKWFCSNVGIGDLISSSSPGTTNDEVKEPSLTKEEKLQKRIEEFMAKRSGANLYEFVQPDKKKEFKTESPKTTLTYTIDKINYGEEKTTVILTLTPFYIREIQYWEFVDGDWYLCR